MNAVDLADTDEDQSEENLDFVFNIIKSIADDCNDNVSADRYLHLFVHNNFYSSVYF